MTDRVEEARQNLEYQLQRGWHGTAAGPLVDNLIAAVRAEQPAAVGTDSAWRGVELVLKTAHLISACTCFADGGDKDCLAMREAMRSAIKDLLKAAQPPAVAHVARCLCCDYQWNSEENTICEHCDKQKRNHPTTDPRCKPGLLREAEAVEREANWWSTRMEDALELDEQEQERINKARAEVERLRANT